MKRMRHKKPRSIVIDAANIITGGGLNHLSRVLLHADPKKNGFEQIIVCASKNTLDQIPSTAPSFPLAIARLRQ